MRVGQPNPRNWRNVPRKPRYIWLLATRQLARKRQRSLMSLLITSPATVAAAATHLAGIGSALSTANAAAAAPTTALSVAGADEVSVLIAALFEAYAQEYQALSAQALAFHDQFVQALNMGAVCYAAAETANATPLQALQTVQQNVLTVVNAPTQALLGRPIIGNGANGLPNTGQDGGPGGLLFGNGGNGGSGGVDHRRERAQRPVTANRPSDQQPASHGRPAQIPQHQPAGCPSRHTGFTRYTKSLTRV